MSKIIVPDDVLDSLLCDKCHRYLSVKPVKVGKRKILCGRCVDQKNNDFVNSYYGVFAEGALFKCVNHFDGCDKLLPYDKVVEHERHCISEEYDCLFCQNDALKVPAYMLYHHVRTKHFKSFLSKNTFTVELTHLKVNTFFHRIGNYLFFIKESFNNNDSSIFLCVIGVGKYFETSSLVTKFSIILEGRNVIDFQSETWDENYIMDTANNKYTVVIDGAEDNQKVTINFEIEVPSFPMFVQTCAVLYPSIEDELISLFKSSSPKITEEDSMVLSLSKLIKNELAVVDQKGQTPCRWSRLLKFAPNKNCNSWHVSISTCETKLIINRFVNAKLDTILICVHCVLCKCICRDIAANFVTKHGSLRHLVCSSCSFYVSKFTELIPLGLILPNEIFSSIQYSCISKCRIYGSPDNNDNIYNHYESTLLIDKTCCMEDCEFQATSVSSFVDHFQFSHDTGLAFLVENLMECIDITIPANATSEKIYVLQYDILIEVLLTFNSDSNEYGISAKVSDRRDDDLNLLMHVCKEVDGQLKHFGTFFDREITLEATVREVAIRCFML